MKPSNQVFDQKLFYIFLILIFWLPLPLGSNRPWAWHLMEIVSYGLTAWWLILYTYKKVTITQPLAKSHWLFIPLLSFSGIILIQLAPLPSSLIQALRPVDLSLEPSPYITLSIDSFVSWIHFKQTLAFICLAFLTLALTNTRDRLRKLALTFVITGVIQALYGALMTLSNLEYGFFIKKEAFHGVATGTFWNRNHMANFLTLCLSVGIGLLLSELYEKSSSNWRERGRRLITSLMGNKARVRICLAIMVIALVLTHSRMGNTAFFFSLVAAGLIWLFMTKRVTKGSLILLISLLIIDTLIVGAWFGIDKVAERLEGTALTKESRDEVNRDTLTLITNQPLLGSGAGTFYTAFPQYRGDDITLYYDHAHNDYLQLVAEHGFIGVTPLALLLLTSFTTAISTMRNRRTLLFQALAFAPIMAISAILLHSTVDFNLQIPANAAFFVIILSMSWVVRYLPRKTYRRRERSSR
ncbi:O-antigen ligase family protein [Litoribrevibacter albus]|uniref:O-antigen ligase family protein n=1 Tax=Litoribrevibacter albus TaxID=1473156 RepID=UPI0024E143C9|nr:O-antigen ligase family protein [Litoribrevibacter albus]